MTHKMLQQIPFHSTQQQHGQLIPGNALASLGQLLQIFTSQLAMGSSQEPQEAVTSSDSSLSKWT